MSEPIVIENYTPEWEGKYEREKTLILQLIGQWLSGIEHIGSTSVPGLGGKAIIDIMLGVQSLEDAKFCIPALMMLGYEYVPEYEKDHPERKYFRKSDSQSITHHLHMVEKDNRFWREHLLFRDYLRYHPKDADSYYQLKLQLAEQFQADRNSFTQAKTDFIHSILQKAEELNIN